MGAWINRREVVDGARRIRTEKMREHQYREGYIRSPDGKRVECNGENNVEHIWEKVKLAMVESARKVWGSVKVGGGNPKNVCWDNEIKATLKRKGAAWKEVLEAKDEVAKERCLEIYKEKKNSSGRR